MDVTGGEHGLVDFREDAFVQAAFDAALAIGQLSTYDRVHSKPSVLRLKDILHYLSDVPKNGSFEFFQLFSRPNPAGYACLRG
jgi:hypothetical protein